MSDGKSSRSAAAGSQIENTVPVGGLTRGGGNGCVLLFRMTISRVSQRPGVCCPKYPFPSKREEITKLAFFVSGSLSPKSHLSYQIRMAVDLLKRFLDEVARSGGAQPSSKCGISTSVPFAF